MLRDGSVDSGAFEDQACGGGGEHGDKCDRLHRKLKRIVKARAALDLEEAAALREAQQLMIWRRYGYASLLEYMEREMGFSPRAALERLRVAHAIVELPQLAAAMEQGEMSFSGVRELTRVATPETEQKWIESTKEMNLRELEDSVSGHKRGDLPEDPVDPSLRTKVIRLEVRPEAFALWRQLQQALEKEKGERLDDTAIVEAVAGAYLRGADAGSPRAAAYSVAVTVCEGCQKGWQDGGNTTVEMSPASVERALCDAVIIGRVDGADPARRKTSRTIGTLATTVNGTSSISEQTTAAQGSASSGTDPEAAPQASASSSTAPVATAQASASMTSTRAMAREALAAAADAAEARPKRTIPAKVRRQVERRDHGRCQVPGCRSAFNVDQHHIKHWIRGGTHTVDNLISLCEGHHNAHHDGTLAIRIEDGKVVFQFQGRNNFTRVQRAVEATRALRELGFDKETVRQAIARTKTHVGNSDLSLHQWIEIARGYCTASCTG